MAEATIDREDWMRRTGPLYPALVALGCLTCLPLPKGLVPNRDDVQRSAPWLPIVGAALGLVTAGIAIGLWHLGMAASVAGSLALIVSLALTGAMLELGTARSAEVLLGRYLPATADSDRRRIGTLAIVCVLGFRGIALWGIDPTMWLGALVVAAMSARWVTLMWSYIARWLAHFMGGRGDEVIEAPERVRATLLAGSVSEVAFAAVTVVVLFIAAVSAAISGLIAMVVAGLCAAVVGMIATRTTRKLTGDSMATLAALSELAVLLTFAALHPPLQSPWLGG